MKIKVLIADDNDLFRELLTNRFALTTDIEVVAEASTGAEILDKLKLTNPDILLTEVVATRLNGIEVAKSIRKQFPTVKIIALTNHFEKHLIKGMLEAQSCGYLMKNITFHQLSDCIRQVHEGKKHLSSEVQNLLIDDYLDKGSRSTGMLTRRESEVLKLLAEGKSIKDISETYFISIKTAGTHKQNIFEKMGFENMAQLVKYALKSGIVS